MVRWEKLRYRMIKSLAQIHSVKVNYCKYYECWFYNFWPHKVTTYYDLISPQENYLICLLNIFASFLIGSGCDWGCPIPREMTVVVANTVTPAFSHTTLLGLAPFILLAIPWEGSCLYPHFQMRHSTKPRSPSQKLAELGFISSRITNRASHHVRDSGRIGT